MQHTTTGLHWQDWSDDDVEAYEELVVWGRDDGTSGRDGRDSGQEGNIGVAKVRRKRLQIMHFPARTPRPPPRRSSSRIHTLPKLLGTASASAPRKAGSSCGSVGIWYVQIRILASQNWSWSSRLETSRAVACAGYARQSHFLGRGCACCGLFFCFGWV